MAGVPLVLGLLVCPTWQVVLARVVATSGVLLLQRLPAMKTAYNLAAYAFETALAGTLLHGLWPGDERVVSLRAGIAVVVVLALVDAVMSLLVLLLIRAHGNPVGRPELVEALVPTGGVQRVLLGVRDGQRRPARWPGPLGWVLLAGLTTGGAAAYRTHSVLTARHASLEQVSTFVAQDEDGGSRRGARRAPGRPRARAAQRGLRTGAAAPARQRRPAAARRRRAGPAQRLHRPARRARRRAHARLRRTKRPSWSRAARRTPSCARGWPTAARATPSSCRCRAATGRCGVLDGDRPALGRARRSPPDDLTMLRDARRPPRGRAAAAPRCCSGCPRGDPRPPDRPAQPGPAAGAARRRRCPSTGGPPVALLHARPRPLQGGQRHARPRLRRPPAAGGRGAPRGCDPAGATVARLGGDEFAVLLTGRCRRTARGAERVALALREAMRRPGRARRRAAPGRGEHRHRHDPSGRPAGAAAAGATCSATPTPRCTRPRAAGSPCSRVERGDGPRPRRAAGAARRPAAGAAPRRARPALPAQGRPADPRRSPAWRRWCAGSTRGSGCSLRTCSSRSPSRPASSSR